MIQGNTMHSIRTVMTILALGGITITRAEEPTLDDRITLQQAKIAHLEKKLATVQQQLAEQKKELTEIARLAVQDKNAEATAKSQAESEKKAVVAALAAELSQDAEKAFGKNSVEAKAALADFGVHILGVRIKKYWRLPSNIPSNLKVKLHIKFDPKGDVTQIAIKQSSGNKRFDDSAIKAVHDASPLPLPKHPGAVEALVTDGIIASFDP